MTSVPKRLSVTILSVLAATFLSAQQPASSQIRIREVSQTSVLTPEYSYSVRGSTKRDGRARWLQLSTVYETAPRWLDDITFTYFVMLRGKAEDLPEGSSTPYTMFSGSVTYVNIPKGDHISTMFLDPKTFARFGEVEAVTVEVSVGSDKAGGMAVPKKMEASQWWTKTPANNTPLLNRQESPWRFVEIELHETIQP